MKVLITGGTGFIGRYLVQELLGRGMEVTVLTSKKDMAAPEDHLDMVQTTYSYDDVMEKLSGRTYDRFYHLGWGGVDGSRKNDIFLQYNNIGIALDMLRVSKALHCEVFIATGTVAEYVFSRDVIDFAMKQTPNDVYGATKVAVHYMLEAVAKQIGQNMIWAVLPSTFGPGRRGDNIITYTIRTLLEGRRPLYGKLDQMWDFLYVTEVTRALAEIGEKGSYNMTYGIGSGQYRLLRDYIRTIRDMIDPELPLGIGERESRGTEPFSSCVNIEQLTKDTGFVPSITFEEGIRQTISYYRLKAEEH